MGRLTILTLVAAVLLVGCRDPRSSPPSDVVTAFEQLIERSATRFREDEPEVVLRDRRFPEAWVKMYFEVDSHEYDVQKATSVVPPYVATLQVQGRLWQTRDFATEDEAAAASGGFRERGRATYELTYWFQQDRWVLHGGRLIPADNEPYDTVAGEAVRMINAYYRP